MSPDTLLPDLRGSCVVSLRPVGDHAPLRRVAARAGARVLALSPWRIAPCSDACTRADLDAALRADVVLFTSPAAVRAAAALQSLQVRRGQAWVAVGAGTATALRKAGVAEVAMPARMDSEGLLALPVLQDLRDRTVGLVTAPGGRDLIATTLARRGARLLRADVYARVPVALAATSVARLRESDGPLYLALSSGQALQRVLAGLPAEGIQRLQQATVLAASARLAGLARSCGFHDIRIARDARPHSLLLAAADRPGLRSG